MKKHKKRKPDDAPERQDRFTEAELSALNKAGLNASDLLFCCKGDMDERCDYCDSFLWFDPRRIVIVLSETEIGPAEKKRRHLEPKIGITDTKTFSLNEIDKIRCERYVSTGRLILEAGGKPLYAIGFSMSKIEGFDRFAQAYNSYKEKGAIELPPKEE